MRRQVLAGVALAAVLSAGSVPTAGAVIKDGNCQSGEVCMYRDGQLTGNLYDNDTGSDGDLSNNNYVGTSTSVNNSISSINNRTSIPMAFYDGYNHASHLVTLCPGQAGSWTTSSYAYINDDISSHRSRASC